MLREAVMFAVKAHEGQVRKGTEIPYITHPLEAAVIASALTDDEEIRSAAVLHDVVEDAGIRKEELAVLFGERVAGLVMSLSEDKSKSWQERKDTAVRLAAEAPKDVKILVLCDKLSNMRSTARDYLMLGDRIWDRFNEKRKDRQADYYFGMAKALESLKKYPYYGEYLDLCRMVFGPENR